MSSSKFIGTGVAMVTPFSSDKSVDFDALTKLTEHIINNGPEYLVVLGTTAETATLNKDEKQAVVSHILKVNNGRLPVVIGIGGNNTQELVTQIKNFDFTGIDGLLSASPAYNKPNQQGLYEHYKAIAEVSPVPVILYNVPSRTASNIEAETTVRLAHDFDNIVAIKEATNDMNQVAHIAKNKPKDFLLISGNDNLALPVAALGGSGNISVIANAYPQLFSDMVRNAIKGDYVLARKQQFDLLESIDAIFEDGNPGGIKAVLEILDIVPNHLRLPLTPVNEETFNKLQQLSKKLA